MVMNWYILFLISLPEAFLNAIIILLFAGEKSRLKINKPNVIRFIVCLIALLVVTECIRPLAQNVIENILFSALAYILVFFLIYRLKLSHAALSVAFAILLFSTIENSYLPFIIAYISKGIENFLQHYQLFVVYEIPSRFFQLAVIFYLWKYEILLVTRISKRFHKVFILSSFILIFIEYFFGYIFYSYFNILPLYQQIIYGVALISLVIVFNFIVFKTIYIVIGGIISNGYKQYTELEDNAKLAFNMLYELLKSNQRDDAMRIIEGLQCDSKIK